MCFSIPNSCKPKCFSCSNWKISSNHKSSLRSLRVGQRNRNYHLSSVIRKFDFFPKRENWRTDFIALIKSLPKITEIVQLFSFVVLISVLLLRKNSVFTLCQFESAIHGFIHTTFSFTSWLVFCVLKHWLLSTAHWYVLLIKHEDNKYVSQQRA